MISKALGFAAIATAIFTIPTTASAWPGCTEVSFETLFAIKNAENTYIGPQGLYATTVDNQCVYVDASVGSSFANDHPEDHAWFVSVAQQADATGIDFLTPNKARGLGGLEERQVGCGSICDTSQSSSKRCGCGTCQYDYTFCGTGGWCTAYYRCK